MGWTSYHVDGEINKKEEIEKNLICKVVKAVMKGNTWYGACETKDGKVIGGVVLVSVRNNSYYNFNFKVIEESMGPNEAECPESILGLLSPTDSEWANEWRDRCHEYNKRKSFLQKLPTGSIVRCLDKNWKKAIYRGKTKWLCWNSHQYIAETILARRGFDLVKEGGCDVH